MNHLTKLRCFHLLNHQKTLEESFFLEVQPKEKMAHQKFHQTCMGHFIRCSFSKEKMSHQKFHQSFMGRLHISSDVIVQSTEELYLTSEHFPKSKQSSEVSAEYVWQLFWTNGELEDCNGVHMHHWWAISTRCEALVKSEKKKPTRTTDPCQWNRGGMVFEAHKSLSRKLEWK